MRRPIAFALAAAIFAGIAFCFLRPAAGESELHSYGEFGNIRALYLEDERTALECEGETDLLSVELSSRMSDLLDTCIVLRAAEGRAFSMGTVPADELYDPSESLGVGYIERETSGGWEFVEEIKQFSLMVPAMLGYKWGTVVVRDEELSLPLDLPLSPPGRYRVTLNFREVFFEGDSARVEKTDDEVHQISFYYENPPKSDKKYDILDIRLVSGYNVESLEEAEIWLNVGVRANEGEPPYLYNGRDALEVLRDGKFVPVEGFFSLAQSGAEQLYGYRRSELGETAAGYEIHFRELEWDTEYRATLYFAETKGGEADMPLRFCFKTGEKPTISWR